MMLAWHIKQPSCNARVLATRPSESANAADSTLIVACRHTCSATASSHSVSFPASAWWCIRTDLVIAAAVFLAGVAERFENEFKSAKHGLHEEEDAPTGNPENGISTDIFFDLAI